MNPTTPLHEDPHDLPPETPHQEAQRCTRNNPCRMQDCIICPTPTNHVRNQTEEMGTDDSMPNLPTSSEDPPPPNHVILILTKAFKTAIKENRIHILKGLSKQYLHQVDTNLEFFMFYHSDLEACYQTPNDIINSHSTTIADPPPPSFNNLEPVSNLLSLIHLPGLASLQTSTPGCRPS